MGSQLHAVTVANGHVYTADRNLSTGVWTPWYDLQVPGLAGPLSAGVTEVTVAATGSTMHVVVVAGGRLLEATADYAAGRWNQWGDISGVLGLPTGALNRIAASANGNVMHINDVGTDGRIHVADADYNRGVWAYGDITSAVGPLSGTVTGLATVAVGSKQQLLVLVDGKVKQAIADYAAGSWNGWGDISAITGQTTPLTKLSVTYTGNSLRLFGVGGGRILNANGDYAAGAWSGWMDTQAPGAAGPIPRSTPWPWPASDRPRPTRCPRRHPGAGGSAVPAHRRRGGPAAQPAADSPNPRRSSSGGVGAGQGRLPVRAVSACRRPLTESTPLTLKLV